MANTFPVREDAVLPNEPTAGVSRSCPSLAAYYQTNPPRGFLDRVRLLRRTAERTHRVGFSIVSDFRGVLPNEANAESSLIEWDDWTIRQDRSIVL